MIEERIARLLREQNFTWSLDTGFVSPTIQDVSTVLDEAAATLKDEPEGSILEIGGVLVIKKHSGYDTYCFTGPYI